MLSLASYGLVGTAGEPVDSSVNEGIGTSFKSSVESKIIKYCKNVAKYSDQNFPGENACVLNEQFAVFELSDIDQPLPKKTVGHCKALSDAKGGSYQVMLRCLKDELSANGAL